MDHKAHSSEPVASALRVLNDEIEACRRCARLVNHREKVAREKRRAFREWKYWGKPVPGFGDARAKLLIIGLAPAAHGGNRTGRVFTGDRSGDFLHRRLCEAGFANQPTSAHRDDGLELRGTYVTATVRCAPPANKPLPSEAANCRPYLERELEFLKPRVVLALGKIAFDAYLKLLLERGEIVLRSGFVFRHGANYALPNGVRLFAVYHPSQQNTQTGKLTAAMYRRVLRRIRRFLGNQNSELRTQTSELKKHQNITQSTQRHRGRRESRTQN
jgi:uracil-DNA glycosylase family 4